MNNWKAPFYSAMHEMDKTAIVQSLIFGGLTAMDVGSQAKEMKKNVQLNPLKRDTQFKLAPPSSYQFEGGKHTPLKETRSPSFSLYD